MPTFLDREFAGEMRRFQLLPADPDRLYRGIEAEGLGNFSEFAKRAAAGTLGAGQVEVLISHALSRGHPVTLMRMRDLVRSEMQERPFTEFLELAVAITVTAFAGSE